MPRIGFDLTRRPYGHQQQPAVIRADNMPKAEQMTWDQFDAMYLAIKAELGDDWVCPGVNAKELVKTIERRSKQR
jgi:hypothetical protein